MDQEGGGGGVTSDLCLKILRLATKYMSRSHYGWENRSKPMEGHCKCAVTWEALSDPDRPRLLLLVPNLPLGHPLGIERWGGLNLDLCSV
jgi:hypothetical protein